MDIIKLENYAKKVLERFPLVKKIGKRFYHSISYFLSKEKIICEGNIIKLTPNDGYEYFFGYYDKSPWDITDRYVLALRAKKTYKNVAPKESAQIVLIDTLNDNKITFLAKTKAWNVQQGCMLQWIGPKFDRYIIFNDFRNEKFCSVIYDIKKMKEIKILPMAIYDISCDGKYALSLDFTRLHRLRAGYGYSNIKEKDNSNCPNSTCIWKINIESGKIVDLIKYTDLNNFEHNEKMDGAKHKVNHIMIRPDGKRFMVIHRYIKKGKKYSRLLTMDNSGNNIYNLSDDVFVSHCFWKNNNDIISFLRKKKYGNHYYLLKDMSEKYKLLLSDLNTDGHCSYSKNLKYIVTDTYPNRKRLASLFLCKESGEYERIARFFSPFKYDNETRCDLHPRWNHNNNKICVDSVHEGKRGMYVIDLGDEV